MFKFIRIFTQLFKRIKYLYPNNQARVFSNTIERFLIDKARKEIQDKKELEKKIDEIKSKKNEFRNSMKVFFQEFDLERSQQIRIANYTNSFDEVKQELDILLQAKKMELDEYMNASILINLLKKKRNLSIFFGIARDFKNFKLYEDQQGDFKRLIGLVSIKDEQIRDIVDVMIYTKNVGCPVRQKKIVKYFDSNRPHSEDLVNFRDAILFANENGFLEDLQIEDFIHIVKYKRKPLSFVKNYYKIKKFNLPIPLEKFKYLNLEEKLISELISLLVKLQLADFYIDFDILYRDIYQGRDVWHVLQYLIKFNNSGLNYFTYNELRTYMIYGKTLKNLHRALLDYKSTLEKKSEEEIEKEIKQFYSYCLKIYISKDDEIAFNAIKLNLCFNNAKKYGLTKEQIVNDYLAGYDVASIILLLNYAESKLLKISYELAKLYIKFGIDLKNQVIFPALVPSVIETPEVKVTTKDNVEIKTKLNIELLLQVPNFFNGFGEDVLAMLANILFIEEVQRHYNHDEIIVNIDKIEKNILTRLYTESSSAILEYFDKSKMTKVKNEEEHEEEELDEAAESHIDIAENKDISIKEISLKKISEGPDIELIKISKYKPIKILIPRIEFVEATFKEYEKVKEKFELHKEKEKAELEAIKAEIELKRAWAESKDLKYLILKDDEKSSEHHEH